MLALCCTLVGCGDPGAWRSRAPASFARQEVSFVYAPSVGKFFLAGGDYTNQEAYDPATNTWTSVAPLPAALDHIQSVELNGRIYYIGGLVDWPGPAVGTVNVYNPATNSFTTGAPMLAGRERGAGGVAVHSGKIYYAGGLHGSVAVPWFDEYNPATNKWTRLPNLPESRDHFQAEVVGNRFYAIGGRNTDIDATTSVNDAFDFGTGSWVTGLAPLPSARGGFATAVVGAKILLIGGEGGGHTFSTVEGYDTESNSWSRFAQMPTARHGIEGAVCKGDVYVAGGGTQQGGDAPTNVLEVLSMASPATCP